VRMLDVYVASYFATRWMSGSGGEPVISGQWSVVSGQRLALSLPLEVTGLG